ncbi:hypothetical protein D3C72_621220 [compost metagenome]
MEEVTPRQHAQRRCQQVGGQRIRAFEVRRNNPQQILQHKARRARPRIHRRQNKQRLEQDGEVIPERHIHQPAERAVQNIGHPHRQRRRTTRTGDNRLFPHFVSDMGQGFRRNRKAPAAHYLRRRGYHVNGSGRRQHRHRAVHRKVHARIDNAGRDQRHNRDEGLHQHTAVANQAGLIFIGQHLRRGARCDQGMEARNGTTGDSDKQEREQVTGPDRAGTVDKFGQRRHRQGRAHDQNPDRQPYDSTDFEEGGEVIARGQQQPDRQNRRHKTVAHQHPGQLHASKVKVRRPDRAFRHPAAGDNREDQEEQANHRHFTNAPRADIANVDPHENRQRDGKGHGVRSPRAVGQGFHHDHRQHRQNDHHDHKGGDQGDHPCRCAHLLFHQLTERAPVAAGRDEQHHKILHRTGQHHAREDPDHPREIAHLRRQHRPDERPGSGNRRKMVAEQHFFIRRDVVQPVVMTNRRCHARAIYRQHFVSNKAPVKTIRDQINADGSDDNP